MYVIEHTATAHRYIGRRAFFDKIRGRLKESHWLQYFGSSKYLDDDLEAFGKSTFTRIVTGVYNNREETSAAETALQLELDVVNAKLPDGTKAFYNRHINGTGFIGSFERTASSRRKQSEKTKGVPKPVGFGQKVREALTGRPPSKKCRHAAYLAKKNKKRTIESRRKQSCATKGRAIGPRDPETVLARSAVWFVSYPDENVEFVHNLKTFCQERRVNYGHLAFRGRSNGYRAVKIGKTCTEVLCSLICLRAVIHKYAG